MLRLALRVRRPHAELVLAELLELAPSGVEEVAVGEDVVEYAIYGTPGEVPSLPEMTAAAGGSLVEIVTEEVADDWGEHWRAFHKPLVIDRVLTVRPPWEPPGDTEIDVVIDPGQAFGTGSHPTTRLCLELMLGLKATGSFVDLGCGSGVLAIVATKLGWSPVLALDNDPASLKATSENARANRSGVQIRHHDLRADPPPAAEAIAANLLAPLLLTWAPRLGRAVEPPKRVIASGVLDEEADKVFAAFASRGFTESGRTTSGGWTALLLERAEDAIP